ncbi:MAG: TetR/AcrR family transcriptional regulator [Anaerolineae bacterium]|nr:TetR/AcrR family transcriptional regulator [Anaerolineae bacterium]
MPKSSNKEREQRILDAAANLFVHYGYDKTAVSDIARDAGVSQGAIYLHFESKDALFESLLIREMKSFSEIWLERVEADPDGGRIVGLYKNMLYALSHNAFMSAMFKQDRHIFGSYLRKPNNVFHDSQTGRTQSTRYEFIKLMQEAGAVRQDLDPKVVAHIMNILAYGLVGMDDIVAPEEIPPLDDLIEGIADIMERALVPEGGGDTEAGKAIVRQIFDASRQQYEQMNETEQE